MAIKERSGAKQTPIKGPITYWVDISPADYEWTDSSVSMLLYRLPHTSWWLTVMRRRPKTYLLARVRRLKSEVAYQGRGGGRVHTGICAQTFAIGNPGVAVFGRRQHDLYVKSYN